MKQPRYREIADQLRMEIARGDYSELGKLPTEQRLCHRFTVSRFTVREALKMLISEDLIMRKRGSGTIILEPDQHIGMLQQLPTKFGGHQPGRTQTTVSFKKMPAQKIPDSIKDQTGAESKRKWLICYGKQLALGRVHPIATALIWVNPDLIHIFEQIDDDEAMVFNQISAIGGISVSHVTQDIQAIAASKKLATELGVETGGPILRIIRCYFDKNNRLLEISSSHHPGDLYAYSMNMVV